MKADLTSVLRTFRRQMAVLRVLRTGGIVLLIISLVALPDLRLVHAWSGLAIGLGLLILAGLLAANSVRLAREVQAGGVLISIGKFDDAEVWLRRGLTQFAISRRAKIMAAQMLASLFTYRRQYEDTVAICRELLRQPIRRLEHIWIDTRLMLADSLLALGRLAEAHEAMLPLFGTPLSLEARMKLLPIQLRYELAAGHAAFAVSALRQKVQLAELMDSPSAGLTHALLAEACRRQNLTDQQTFLADRARLYHDLEPLARLHPVIEPIAALTEKM